QGENPDFLKVNNPDQTSGGTRTETPEVSKAEVDKPVSTLHADLDRSFQNAIETGAGAPEGTTLFPATAQPGVAVPDVDPQTLVGQAVEPFELGLTAKGTVVVAVDP